MAKPKYQEWMTEKGLKKIEKWARLGLSEEQIAHNMGISRKCLSTWKNDHSDILHAIKKGREVIILELENALVKSGKGYEYEEVITERRDGDLIETRRVKKHMPPNPTSLIFALKNMAPDKWRDRKETQIAATVQAEYDGVIFLSAEEEQDAEIKK